MSVSVVQTCETRLPGNLGGWTLYGDRGTLRAGRDGAEWFGEEPGAPPRLLSYPGSELSDYALELEAFADTVAGCSEGPTTARSERRSLAIVLAGYESAARGETVRLKERFGQL